MGLNGENLVKLCQISQYGLIFIVSGLIWIKRLKVGLIRSDWVKLGLLGKRGLYWVNRVRYGKIGCSRLSGVKYL